MVSVPQILEDKIFRSKIKKKKSIKVKIKKETQPSGKDVMKDVGLPAKSIFLDVEINFIRGK